MSILTQQVETENCFAIYDLGIFQEEFVEKMLEAKKSLGTAQTDKDKAFYARYCETLDKQIDDIVYELYGLSLEERKVVEGK